MRIKRGAQERETAKVRKRKEGEERQPSELRLSFQPSSLVLFLPLCTPPLISPCFNIILGYFSLFLFILLCYWLYSLFSAQADICTVFNCFSNVNLNCWHFLASLGAQIIDLMMLVVDVVKGVQTQTAECLLIGELTCPRMVVVLNKIDLLPPDKRQTAIEKMTKRLHKTLESTRSAFSPSKRRNSGVEVAACKMWLQTVVLVTCTPQRSDFEALVKLPRSVITHSVSLSVFLGCVCQTHLVLI